MAGGGIWFLVEGFKVSVAWGVGMLLCGFISLGFLFQRWDVAQRPFFTQLAGMALWLIGLFISGKGVAEMYNPLNGD